MSAKDTGVVNIHGREYKTVGKRVDEFRKAYSEKYGLITDLIENGAERVVIRAQITNEEGRVVATGYAEERRGSSMINKTAALENCETSAIGRALANFGFGGGEYASADEVASKLSQQNEPKEVEPAYMPNKWDTYRVNYDEINEALANCETLEAIDKYAAELAKKHPKLTENQKKTIGEKFNKRREEARQ